MMLVKLFIQTDPTVLPIGLVLSLISNLASGVSRGAHCVLRDTLHPVTGAAWMRKRNAVGGFGFEAVETVNDTRKRAMARKVSSIFSGVLRGKTVAILGLTFKPNTDDMREAPSIPLIMALQDMGAREFRQSGPMRMSMSPEGIP
jgi:UDP-glucose 6-dehydrogenase